MINKEWGLVALEDGRINAGKLSEHFVLGSKVVRVESPANDYGYFSENYKPEEIRGIKLTSEEEVNKIYPKILELNKKIEN